MSLIYQTELVGGRRHGLYLGGKSDAKSREMLERCGITHILNVTPPKEGGIQVTTLRHNICAIQSFSTSLTFASLNKLEGIITIGRGAQLL